MGQKRGKVVGFREVWLAVFILPVLTYSAWGSGQANYDSLGMLAHTIYKVRLHGRTSTLRRLERLSVLFYNCVLHDSCSTTVAFPRTYSDSRLQSCARQPYAGFTDTFFLRLRCDLVERSR
jgi:hypothetical protein